MLDILKSSLATPGSVGGYPLHIRKMLVHQIINQQSNEVFDMEPGEELSWNWEDLDEENQEPPIDLDLGT